MEFNLVNFAIFVVVSLFTILAFIGIEQKSRVGKIEEALNDIVNQQVHDMKIHNIEKRYMNIIFSDGQYNIKIELIEGEYVCSVREGIRL